MKNGINIVEGFDWKVAQPMNNGINVSEQGHYADFKHRVS